MEWCGSEVKLCVIDFVGNGKHIKKSTRWECLNYKMHDMLVVCNRYLLADAAYLHH